MSGENRTVPVEAAFEYVAVSVGDLDLQQTFYAQAFGLTNVESRLDIATQGIRSVILSADNGLRVELIESAGSAASGPMDAIGRARTQGYTHAALRVGHLQIAIEAVVRAGGSIISEPAKAQRLGVHYAFVGDPEGTLIELVERA